MEYVRLSARVLVVVVGLLLFPTRIERGELRPATLCANQNAGCLPETGSWCMSPDGLATADHRGKEQ